MKGVVPERYGSDYRVDICAKVAPQNIDFQTTILSRFDMIFIVKDEHNEQRDRVCGVSQVDTTVFSITVTVSR